jgi:hypothetical protein
MSARIIHLPSGRPVLDTGKVLVGLRHGEQRPVGPTTADQQRLQTALQRPLRAQKLTEAELDRALHEQREWYDSLAEQMAEQQARRARAGRRRGTTRLLAAALAVAILALAAAAVWA